MTNTAIKTFKIKADDRFWHDGELYTASGDATYCGGSFYRVPVKRHDDAGPLELTLHVGGNVLRA